MVCSLRCINSKETFKMPIQLKYSSKRKQTITFGLLSIALYATSRYYSNVN